MILSAFLIIASGFVILAVSIIPTEKDEKSSEIRMKEGGFWVEQFPDVGFGSEMSISVDFRTDNGGGNGISLYFMDEDNHDEFMEWVEKENNTTAAEKLNELEFICKRNCSKDCEFDLSVEDDGDVYLVVVNHGEAKDLTLTVKTTMDMESGVCFAVFFILGLIGVLVIRAALQIEDRPPENFGGFES